MAKKLNPFEKMLVKNLDGNRLDLYYANPNLLTAPEKAEQKALHDRALELANSTWQEEPSFKEWWLEE